MTTDAMYRQRARTRPFTVGEYHRMHDAGILTEDDRVELIDGEIVEMSPIGSRHAACVDRLAALLFAGLRGRAQLRVQSPICLDERNEPQPDVALLRVRADAYANAHPGPSDVLLAVEVADETLALDRTIKLSRYAAAGIPEVWVVNLPESCVEVYRDPRGGSYRKRLLYARNETWEFEAFPGMALAVDDVLPPKAE